MIKGYTYEFCRYLLGLRGASTSDTEAELSLLSSLAAQSHLIIEVGVFEGVASARMATELNDTGRIYLVDPYFRGVLLERLLNFSMAERIARKVMMPHGRKVSWIRRESTHAAADLAGIGKVDLIFIDARHEYEFVTEDFHAWSPLVREGGVLALHDSRVCQCRPDLNPEVGSVKFANELEQGKHGPWEIIKTVDSIAVVKQRMA